MGLDRPPVDRERHVAQRLPAEELVKGLAQLLAVVDPRQPKVLPPSRGPAVHGGLARKLKRSANGNDNGEPTSFLQTTFAPSTLSLLPVTFAACTALASICSRQLQEPRSTCSLSQQSSSSWWLGCSPSLAHSQSVSAAAKLFLLRLLRLFLSSCPEAAPLRPFFPSFSLPPTQYLTFRHMPPSFHSPC